MLISSCVVVQFFFQLQTSGVSGGNGWRKQDYLRRQAFYKTTEISIVKKALNNKTYSRPELTE